MAKFQTYHIEAKNINLSFCLSGRVLKKQNFEFETTCKLWKIQKRMMNLRNSKDNTFSSSSKNEVRFASSC